MCTADTKRIYDLLNDGVCPACSKKCGKYAPRQAVLAHLRTHSDPLHVKWKVDNWSNMKRGPKRDSEEDVVQKILKGWDRERLASLFVTIIAQS